MSLSGVSLLVIPSDVANVPSAIPVKKSSAAGQMMNAPDPPATMPSVFGRRCSREAFAGSVSGAERKKQRLRRPLLRQVSDSKGK